jgi:hypothetical protein
VSTTAGHAQPTSARLATSADGRFATVTPAGFVNETAAAQGGPFNVLYLAVGPRSGGFRPNINVVRERSGGLTDMNTIARAELSGIKRFFPDARQLSSVVPVTVDGEPGRTVDYSNRVSGHLLFHRAVFVERRGWVYSVTYTASLATHAASEHALEGVISAWTWR